MVSEFFSDSDVELAIWRINLFDTAYSVEQKAKKIDRIENEHFYSASANGIDGKKPELKDLASHLEHAYLHGFFQIPIAPKDQDKTTFTCPYGTLAYRRMPFRLCNTPATFQRCMTAIFHDMVDDFMEVFMDEFFVFECHFMVKEGIVLGHKLSGSGIEVDKAKIDVIAKLPYPTNVKGVRSSLGYADIERVNANYTLEDNLQQASTSVTQTDNDPVYDSDGSTEQAQQKQQSLYNGKVLLEKHDPPVVYDSEETLQLAQESRLKMKQLNKEIKPENYAKINQLSEVFVSQKAKSQFSDVTSPSVAQKILNEVKGTIVTLQCVVKQKITLDIHNWSSTAHQELHKIVKDEIFPIVNQVDARVQNFKIQFLKEVAKFVQDFKSLAKEDDESLAKHKTLEYEIKHLLRAVVSQDIMSIMQNNSVVDTSNLQTELDHMKEKLEKKEKEYVVLWNNCYKNVRNVNMTRFHMIKLIMR
ncbi:hypothetical protein Tco_0525908 [Tanacetum coccineum]